MKKITKIYLLGSIAELLLLWGGLIIYNAMGHTTKVGANIYLDRIAISSIINFCIAMLVLFYNLAFKD